MVELSIIIVSWNAKDYLLRCLRSLDKELTNTNAEIIVVDNNSSDGSQETVRRHFSHVKLICADGNLGFAGANNLGIKESSGNYVCFVNPDVEVLEGSLSLMIKYLEENHSVGLLGPKVLNPDLTLQRSCRGDPSLWNTFCRAFALDTLFPKSKIVGSLEMSWWDHKSIRSVDVLSGCFWLVRRAALEEVGPLDERFFMYAEDKDWCKRCRASGWDVVFFPYARIIHFGGGSSANAPTRFYLEQQRANLQYWEKHHGRAATRIEYTIMILHQLVRLCGSVLCTLIKPSSTNRIIPKISNHYHCLKFLLFGGRFQKWLAAEQRIDKGNG